MVQGVLTLEAAPVVTTVACRRYLCRACGAVMLVVPRELSAARRYTLTTIAIALLQFGVGADATIIRERLAPGDTFELGWVSLRRWCRAVAESRLFRWVRGVSELSGRALAKRVSVVLAEASGLDVRHSSLEERVFAGVMSSRFA